MFELSVELPSHGFPPYLGAGLEHVRFLSLDVLPPNNLTVADECYSRNA
jgi:outer membrane protein W